MSVSKNKKTMQLGDHLEGGRAGEDEPLKVARKVHEAAWEGAQTKAEDVLKRGVVMAVGSAFPVMKDFISKVVKPWELRVESPLCRERFAFTGSRTLNPDTAADKRNDRPGHHSRQEKRPALPRRVLAKTWALRSAMTS